MFSFFTPFMEMFFLSGDVPPNAENGYYIPSLVVLSYVIAALGSFIGLRFSTDIRHTVDKKTKNFLHLGGAFAFGAGIWSMHFIGMLAYKMDMAISYEPVLTGLSMVVAVVIAYGVLAIIRSRQLNLPRIIFSALLLGAAICAMHYTGMAAMRMDADLYYIPSLFGLSYLIAVSASASALLIVFVLGSKKEGRKKLLWQILAAMVMGIAICGMHYMGMKAAVFIPWADCRYSPEQSFHTLAMAVAVISSAVFAVALTIGGNSEKWSDAFLGSKVFLQLSLLLSVFLVLLAGSYLLLNGQKQYNEDKVINSAGLQRMLMTRYVHSAYRIGSSQDQEVKAAMRDSMRNDQQSIDSNYQAFLQGGVMVVSVAGRRETIPEISLTEDLRTAIGTAQQHWAQLRSTVTDILERDNAVFLQEDYAEAEAFLATAVQAQDKVVHVMYAAFEEEAEALLLRQEVVLTVGFLTFVLTLLYARYFIVKPIAESQRALEESQQNLQQRVLEQTKDIAQARDKLREEKSYLTAIMDNMMQSLITINKNGTIRTFNKWAEYIFGYQAAEVIGKNVNILMPEPYKSAHDGYLTNYLETGQAKIIGKVNRDDVMAVRADGEVFPISLSVTKVVIKDAPVFIGLISDISEQHQREENLRVARDEAEDAHLRLQNETQTIKLLERMTNAINESADLQGAIEICLQEICGFAGWSAGHAYLVDEKKQKLLPSKIWCLKDVEAFRGIRKMTETTILSPGVGLPGQVYKKKKSVWMKNIMADANFPRAKHMKDLGEQAGFGFPVLVKKEVVAVLEFFSGKLEKPSDDFMSMMASIGTQLGRVIERDKIEKARAEAEKSNHAKSEFLASMSHELRTPLNSIMGLTQMLVEDPALKPDDRNMAGTAHKSAKNLLEIVNDILDISKIEAGNIVLERAGFDFKNVVSSVMETMAPIASGKGIALYSRFMNDDIPYLFGDSLRVSRILTNLIGNAVKYTEQGEVAVTINSHRLPVRDTKAGAKLQPGIEIYCEVKDSGIGINNNSLDLIFDKFTQADASISRKYGGTGLGLAITKELVELMGGRIGVDSKPGAGSVFWIKLPFIISAKEEADAETKQRRSRRKKNAKSRMAVEKAQVLVAEDHLLNQDLLKRLLPRMGFEHFDMVENGAQAVKAFKEKSYDLVLMDCHMPEMNGYEATIAIRKNAGKQGKAVPVIALTADAMKGTREKCLAAGMSDYLSKPIDKGDLKTVLEQWFIFPAQEVLSAQQDDQKEKSSVIDLSLMKEYADTEEEVQAFAEMFIEQSLESLKLLKQNCKAGENTVWVEVAHKMKGGAGMWGAESLRMLCEKAQSLNKATAKERKELYQKIEIEYSRVEKALKKIVSSA